MTVQSTLDGGRLVPVTVVWMPVGHREAYYHVEGDGWG